MYTLYIANRNYSSWSLRPWLLLRELAVPFTEEMVPFHDAERWSALRRRSPNGKVPCLVDGDTIVWESLSIVEYLAERHAGVWPVEPAARAWARSAAAEMHAGFGALRSQCSMSCGVRIRLHHVGADLTADLTRVAQLWNDGLKRFGGPFLAGAAFTAVDAFFAPVALRLQSYGLTVEGAADAYGQRLLERPALREWYAAALAEPWRDLAHEQDSARHGVVLQDLRAPQA